MPEINLLSNYPKSKRNLDERKQKKTEEIIAIAKKFGKEYFDGDRIYGYGGYNYNPRFWAQVVRDMIEYYELDEESKILDIGCAKGFMIYDFKQALPSLTVRGIDISEYAIENSKPEVKEFLSIGNAKDLSQFKDKEFDLVISINTIHNLPLEECKNALKEIQRVGKRAFISLDAWRNDKEEEMMKKWNLTAETYMHADDWKSLFEKAGYTGDYYWFILEIEQENNENIKQELMNFSEKIFNLWEQAKIPYPVHLSGGNEEQLIEIFKEIKKGDYIFSTHRSHYHYILAGGSPAILEKKILKGDSMHICDKDLNFISSSIVAGCAGIAVGVAWALKRKNSDTKVWCFVGDAAEDEGHFYEAVRYADGYNLPCIFIIEDNDRSVETPKKYRYGNSEISWPSCVRRYHYKATYPHVGIGKFVDFSGTKAGDKFM